MNSLDLLWRDGSALARVLAAGALIGMGVTAWAVWQVARATAPTSLAVLVAMLWAASEAARDAWDYWTGLQPRKRGVRR